MKIFIKSAITVCSFTLLTMVLFLASCGPDPKVDPKETEKERVEGLIKGSWTIQNVTIDGVVSNSFASMALSFTGTTYTTNNGGIVWPATGTWSFKDETAKTILRNDGIEINIDAITATSFTLSFTWGKTTLGSGREISIKGKHVFTFKK